MKICSKCSVSKMKTEFYKSSRASDGLYAYCKVCANKTALLWKQGNRTRARELNTISRKNNLPSLAAKEARRRANKHQATVSWANDFFIKEIYHLASLRTKLTGINWEVDHIVPLQSKLVCGLHVETNLQVIPASINRQKHNSYCPDMPVYN